VNGRLRRHLRTFSRATVVSLIATSSELVLLPLLVHVARVRPEAIAFFVVQVVATIITFALNKRWAFDARSVGRTEVQAARQVVICAGSWALNTLLPSWATAHGFPPVVAFVVSNAAVFVFWNYPTNRFWVFRETL
jgi:putative flippase GtrA